MEKSQIMDKILNYLKSRDLNGSVMGFLMENFGLQKGDSLNYRLFIEELEEHKLIKRLENDNHVITNKGKFVCENGGYGQFINELSENLNILKKQQELQMSLAQSNIETNELIRKNNNRNTVFMIINIIAGVLNLLLLAKQIMLPV